MLPIIFVLPIVQLLILVQAATFDLKDVHFAIVDQDRTPTSEALIRDFSSSPYFKTSAYCMSVEEATSKLYDGTAGMAMVIPKGFSRSLVEGRGDASVQLLVDAVNGTNAGLIQAYSTRIIGRFSLHQATSNPVVIPEAFKPVTLTVETRHWYNPELNFKTFMVPGILVLLVTIIGFMISGMNVVREKEIGTIEQLNVTPVKKYQFIIGKMIPFWIIGLFELSLGLLVGKLVFDIPMEGSLWLIFLSAAVYLIVVLSMGLLVSTMSDNQQQSMFISSLS
jgi:ABC-2 type transport system permease protein